MYLSEEDDSPKTILSSYENLEDKDSKEEIKEELKENMLSSKEISSRRIKENDSDEEDECS